MISTAQAVLSLRPGAEWSMTDDDVEGITWHTPGVAPLTKGEVDAEVARLEQEAANAEAARVAALESARAKLAALGLSDSEVAAVMGVQL
jgi:hypothetical protein